jgi:hypothetical protein
MGPKVSRSVRVLLLVVMECPALSKMEGEKVEV